MMNIDEDSMPPYTQPGICTYCYEPLDVPRHLAYLHRECAFRAVAGSVAHLQKRCSCYVPGSMESDPPGMTPRQAALAALKLWGEQQFPGLFQDPPDPMDPPDSMDPMDPSKTLGRGPCQ
jgi:hypothetical protein